ncbi:MAG: restriction endonuclease subunit S [Gemmatimonadetes bacterium]|nr:restriction endonuclease subunit S [Gemmatimonadota bacterium]
MIDLAPNHLETVRSILAEHMPDCEVRAFGSRAKWEGQDYSDLDLAVVCEDEADGRAIERLKQAFKDSDLPIRVDVLDWRVIAEDFRKAIESDCVVVQQAPELTTWQTVRLGSCTVINDQTYSPTEAWTYVNYLDTGNITENRIHSLQHLEIGQDKIPVRARRKARSGDIVYSTVRPNQRHYGLLKSIPENLLVSTGFSVIRGKADIADTDFIYWFLSQDHIVNYLQAVAEHSTSAYPSIRPGDLASLEISLPPIEDQRAIAGVLGALDNRIELNRRMSETLEKMARALFQSWFVDYDPVRAKAEGRPSGLPSDLDALFPASFEESELGEIPEGWRVCNLDDIADFTNGLALQRFPPDGEDGLPAIKIAEMRHGYTHRTGRASAAIDSRYVVEDGDMLFSWSGSLQVVLWSHGPGALNQHLFKVTSDKFPRWFYWGWTLEHLDDFRSIAAGKATTMGHIQRHHLTNAKVVTPPMEVLRAAGGSLATLIDRHVDNAVQSRELVAQREALLPRLLSGKLRMGGAKRSVTASA